MVRKDLEGFVLEALTSLNGTARIVDICKYMWKHHISNMDQNNDLFYTWGYDMRWAGQNLRNQKKIKSLPDLSWTLIVQ